MEELCTTSIGHSAFRVCQARPRPGIQQPVSSIKYPAPSIQKHPTPCHSTKNLVAILSIIPCQAMDKQTSGRKDGAARSEKRSNHQGCEHLREGSNAAFRSEAQLMHGLISQFLPHPRNAKRHGGSFTVHIRSSYPTPIRHPKVLRLSCPT